MDNGFPVKSPSKAAHLVESGIPAVIDVETESLSLEREAGQFEIVYSLEDDRTGQQYSLTVKSDSYETIELHNLKYSVEPS